MAVVLRRMPHVALKHCCAQGYTCTSGKCAKKNISLPFLQVISNTVKKAPPHLDNIECPDGKSQCPDGNTCCLTGSSTYGCCPKVDAVCCHDMIHCCPFGYKCDTSDGKCTGSQHPLLELLGGPRKVAPPTLIDAPPLNNVNCDGESQCPDGNTCCLTKSDTYGCCPKVNAVCCPDRVHCCPEGYSCDTQEGKCKSSNHPLLDLYVHAEQAPPPVEKVICPGGDMQCPDKNTCCSTGKDSYGCCPQANAVCCSDKKHCCPEKYTCDIGRCLRAHLEHPLLQLVASGQVHVLY